MRKVEITFQVNRILHIKMEDDETPDELIKRARKIIAEKVPVQENDWKLVSMDINDNLFFEQDMVYGDEDYDE